MACDQVVWFDVDVVGYTHQVVVHAFRKATLGSLQSMAKVAHGRTLAVYAIRIHEGQEGPDGCC